MGIINIKRRCAYRRPVPVRPFNSELWLLISYAVCIQSKIVSVLLLCWLEFIETLWEPLIPRGNLHIVGLFRSGTLTPSYFPWLVMQYAYRAKIVSVQPLCNYWLEFNETLWEPSIPRASCAYCCLVPVRHFNTELWPLISNAVFI
jgi:hypothetical protein